MRLFHQQGAKARQGRVERVGSEAQHGRALRHRRVVPGGESADGAVHGGGGVVGPGLGHHRHGAGRVRRQQLVALRDHRQVPATAVGARRAIQIRRQRLRPDRLQPQRRDQQLVHAHRLVGQLVHEGRVGAVLQQAAHQIGQQVAVRTHGRVDTAAHQRVLQHLAVDALAHTVQSLQFKRDRLAGCELKNGGNRAGVVCGELRKNRIRRIQQRLGAGQVAHVGVVLVGEHRVGRQTLFLRALDLGVPVGALDQAAHELDAVLTGQRGDVRDQLHRAGLVGLHGQAQALPLRAVFGHPRGQGLKHVQREFEPVHFLGVNRQVQVGSRGRFAECPHTRHQLGHHAFVLRVFVTRVQGAELDRDAVVLRRVTRRVGALGDGRDGVLVAGLVAQRVGRGARAFAQHVKTELQVRLLFARRYRLLHALTNGLAQHKLAAQQLHRAQGCGHHGARTQLGHQTRFVAGLGQEMLGHRDGRRRQPSQGGGLAPNPGFARPPEGVHATLGRPGGGVGHTVKVRPTELVGGQRDGGFGIGHTQQRLGQAHQGQALGAGNWVLLEQAFHGPEGRRVLAHRAHPGRGHLGGGGPVERPLQGGQALGHGFGLGAIGKGQAVGAAGHGGAP